MGNTKHDRRDHHGTKTSVAADKTTENKPTERQFFDPSQIIARMMEEFDADQDSKLDLQELTALLQSLRDRRGQGRTGQGRTGQGRTGQGRTGQGSPEQDAAGQGRLGGAGKGRPDGAGKGRRGSADGQASPGGEKPKRPAVQ